APQASQVHITPLERPQEQDVAPINVSAASPPVLDPAASMPAHEASVSAPTLATVQVPDSIPPDSAAPEVPSAPPAPAQPSASPYDVPAPPLDASVQASDDKGHSSSSSESDERPISAILADMKKIEEKHQ
ncbi:hypothetical protein U1Q18_014766, partial [Sarracenia purpurea var. burkii]